MFVRRWGRATNLDGSLFSTEPLDTVMPAHDERATKRGPVTVLFADMCGYTSLCETLDPEDLRDVMTQIFGGIAQVASKYEGHIDKLIGDSALILFGVPRAHEDDAVRAIRAAREIHDFVTELSPRLESKTGRALRMHSAISTGVIVTSEVDHASSDSAHGDSITLAARLLSLAGPDEIACAEETVAEAQGYFDFEPLGPKTVKGREGAVNVYLVRSERELPATSHRIWGVRAKLVGRRDEWARLEDAVARLRNGETTVISIRGEAGTGKSRLVEEFRDSLDDDLRWLESSSQPYSQNIPYNLFIQALSHSWGIRDGDAPEVVREKVANNVSRFPAVPANSAAFVQALFGLDCPELRGVDSETWKRQMFQFFRLMLSSAAGHRPTVVYVGDLHWTDPSSLELLRYLIAAFEVPVLLIATYRPPCSLFAGPPPAGLRYEEIRLQNLSPSEAADMLASLLDSEDIPSPLRTYLQEKAEGNPFYLEELVNSLIETGTLATDGEQWAIRRSLPNSDLPVTIVGVIAARLDRLDPSARRVLREASVIGRTFMADVLDRISRDPDFASALAELQKLDLVRVHMLEPRLEYEFKHALIQEVAYAGLLKPERARLHEDVGVALESMFADRLPELYETLALHFSRGTSSRKAVDYLVKSAEKSFERFAIEESSQFYRQAYDVLMATPQSVDRDRELVRVINGWAYVIYDRGNMAELEQLLDSHREFAESLGTTSEHAMFLVCLAIAAHCRERFDVAVTHAGLALEMAEELGDDYVAACARVWLAYGLSELGRPDKALAHAEKAIPVLADDPTYITEAYSALGFARWTKGDAGETLRIGETLLELGRAGPSTRALAAGHWVLGEGYLSDGDFEAAARCFADSIAASPEPWPSQHPRVYLAISYVQLGRYDEAEPYLREVLALSEERGAELTLTPAKALLGVVAFAHGEMSRGMKMLDEVGRIWVERHALMRVCTLEAILGQLYLNLVSSQSPVTVRLIARNVGFLARNVLSAAATSEKHFDEAVRICRETGATGSLGEAYLGLAELYKATGKRDGAREYAAKAIDCFQQVGIKTYLGQAQGLLESLTESLA
jgi:class 3 adenylate cyclase/tetratricopeptide (TPR) repeat protein